MPGDGIILSIRAQGFERIEEIKAQAEKQARDAITAATNKQEAIAERYVAASEDQARADALRAEHAQVISNGRKLSEVKSEFLERAVEAAREKLATVRDEARYADLLLDVSLDALNELGGCATLHVDPRDEELIRSLMPELEKRCSQLVIAPDITTIGGAIAQSSDAKITCDNTFEARLKREYAEHSREIWEVLQQ